MLSVLFQKISFFLLKLIPFRLRWYLINFIYVSANFDFLSFHRINKLDIKLIKLGSHDANWIIPSEYLNSESICYCFGVGEDASFDLEILSRYNCNVFSFDPTPRAISYVQSKKITNKKFKFLSFGIWDKNEKIKFYAPQNKNHVSHSALNLQKTDSYFVAECFDLLSLMEKLNHRNVDLCKLDIEGAEYRVLNYMVNKGIKIPILCVEFDEAYNEIDSNCILRINNILRLLIKNGYRIVQKQSRANYLLINYEKK